MKRITLLTILVFVLVFIPLSGFYVDVEAGQIKYSITLGVLPFLCFCCILDKYSTEKNSKHFYSMCIVCTLALLRVQSGLLHSLTSQSFLAPNPKTSV